MRTKAISPVIATVIIVSVAIAIAVAVAFWMTGITGLFTRYEKLDVINAYAIYNKSVEGGTWALVLTVRNTGTSDVTLDELFINGKPFKTFSSSYDVNATYLSETYFKGIPSGAVSVTNNGGDWAPGSSNNGTYSLPTGEEKTFVIPLNVNDGFKSGQIVEVKLHTAGGNEFPKSVQLP